MTFGSVDRRAFLGGAVISTLMPSIGFAQQNHDPNNQEPSLMRVSFTFADRTMTATLYDSPASRDFFGMLPLDLTISDFGNNEKIAHLPRKLTEEGSGPFSNERPYDLCYYVPWGNLAMFYADYRHPGLIRLGRFDEGYESLHHRGEFSLRVEAI